MLLNIFSVGKKLNTNIHKLLLSVVNSRFLINLPAEEQKDMVRVFFQIEMAHWYYIDFYRQEQVLPTYGLKEFTKVNILFISQFLILGFISTVSRDWSLQSLK